MAPSDKPSRNNKEKNAVENWLPIALSSVALVVSIVVAAWTYNRDQLQREFNDVQVIQGFVSKGEKLRSAVSCFEYANSLKDSDLLDVFRKSYSDVSLTSGDEELLKLCLYEEGDVKGDSLKRESVRKFNDIIVDKLNSYDFVFELMMKEAVDNQKMCRTIWTSFSGGPQQFLSRIKSMSAPPERLSNLSKQLVATKVGPNFCETR